MIRIREIHPDDAPKLVALMEQLDRETDFLLYEEGERPADVETWRDRIENLDPLENGTFLVAEWIGLEDGSGEEEPERTPGELAGYLEVRRMPWVRVRHRAYLVIGIRKSYAGMGVGTRLMKAMETWARRLGIRRLYLTTIGENRAAVGLYRKMGYEIEGRHPASMCIRGRYVDELTMGKWLD